MFERVRSQVDAEVRAGGDSRPDAAGYAWPDFEPPVALADGPLGAIQVADREIARQTALRARAVAEFAPAVQRRRTARRGKPER